MTSEDPAVPPQAGTPACPSFPHPWRALVVGAGGGIGAALVDRLAGAGVDVHALSRGLIEHEPGADGGRITQGRLDLTDEASVAAACAALGAGVGERPPLRLAIVATGLLHDATLQPEKSFRALDAAQLARSFAVNAIGPALVAKHVLPLLPREGRAVFAVLSARVGSIEDNRLGGWYGYRASKAALNQIVRTLAVEVRRTRPRAIVVALHPGTVGTGLSRPFSGGVRPGGVFTPAEAAGHLLRVVDGLREEDSGGFFAWDGSPVPF